MLKVTLNVSPNSSFMWLLAYLTAVKEAWYAIFVTQTLM